MPNGYGYGFRGYSPPWPYIGWGRGGLPRGWYRWGGMAPPYWQPVPTVQMPYPPYGGVWGTPPFYAGAPAPWAMPYAPSMTREEELDFLRDQAQAIKDQLDQIETRMRELESQES